MIKSLKPLICVLVVSDLMLATWIQTQWFTMAPSYSASSLFQKSVNTQKNYGDAAVYEC